MLKIFLTLLLCIIPTFLFAGDKVTQSENFTIVHNQDSDYGDRVAEFAEKQRKRILQFLDLENFSWRSRCLVNCYITQADLFRYTGNPTPGFSELVKEGYSVGNRRISITIGLDKKLPDVWEDIFAHEIAHCCFVEIGNGYLPRWVDEGLACCLETDKRQKEYRKMAFQKSPFDVSEIVGHKDMPRSGNFYGKSYVLVDFLIKQKGGKAFRQFVDSLTRTRDTTNGFDLTGCLKKHYGYESIEALEKAVVEKE